MPLALSVVRCQTTGIVIPDWVVVAGDPSGAFAVGLEALPQDARARATQHTIPARAISARFV
jgi:hypothetical protein